MELDFGEPHPNPSPSFPFKGVVCGAGANTVITPLPEKDVNGVARWEKRVYTDPITADQWFGTVDHGVPDSQMPNSNLNPDKKGHKFKEIKDDCGNKVELYCHNDRFKVFYTDCTGKSYLVAVCEFEFGLNKWEAHIHECPHLGKKAFATIYVKNLNRRNHLQFIQYTFDTCTHDRTRRYIKNFDTTPIEETAEPWKDGQTQPSEDGGVSDFRPPDGFLD